MGYSTCEFFEDLLKKAQAEYQECKQSKETDKYKSLWDCFLEAYEGFGHDEYRQRCLINLLLMSYAKKNGICIESAATEILSLDESSVAVISGDHTGFKLYGDLPSMIEIRVSQKVREENLKSLD